MTSRVDLSASQLIVSMKAAASSSLSAASVKIIPFSLSSDKLILPSPSVSYWAMNSWAAVLYASKYAFVSDSSIASSTPLITISSEHSSSDKPNFCSTALEFIPFK